MKISTTMKIILAFMVILFIISNVFVSYMSPSKLFEEKIAIMEKS